MIKNLKVQNFGSYKNFNGLPEKYEFQKMNLIFGRNYSGKTTLSKIFSYLGNKLLPPQYENPSFSVIFEGGNQVTTFNDNFQQLDILVFNKDFIQNNLSFLLYQHGNFENIGTIKSFEMIQIGEEQIRIENEINQLKESLNIQELIGHSLAEIETYYKEESYKFSGRAYEIDTELQNLLVDAARDIDFKPIKPKRVRQFNKGHLVERVEEILQNSTKIERIYTDEQFNNEIKDINTSQKTIIPISNPLDSLTLSLQKIQSDANALLQKISIQSDPKEFKKTFKEWILQGYELHKQNAEHTCQFCSSLLDSNFYEDFENFLNRADELHKQEMRKLYSNINNFIVSLKNINYVFVSVDNLYISHHNDYLILQKEIKSNLFDLEQSLKQLQLEIEKKSANLDKAVIFDFHGIINCFEIFSKNYLNLIGIYEQNNDFTSNIDDNQENLKKLLLEDCIMKFLIDTNYLQLMKERKDISDQAKILESKYISETKHIVDFKKYCADKINENINILTSQKSNANVAILTINQILKSFFGHENLELQHYKDTNSDYFKILRDSKDAFNLSEGECTLIAFSYFISQIKNLSDDNLLDNFTIYIDDPISSLDNENIFYIYNLIELYICKNLNYKQIFISTHNWEFFKYIKRLTKPPKSIGHYFIYKDKSISSISNVPNYLNNSTTEFNYLFSRIYNSAHAPDSNLVVEDFSIGNDIRKFLETYYYFKYPCQNNKNQFKQEFCTSSDGQNYLALIERVSNEFSHTEEIFDRTLQPVLQSEIKKVANFIISRLRELDERQYNALVESIKDLKNNP